MNRTLRLLKPLLRNSTALKRHHRTVIRALASQSNHISIDRLITAGYQVQSIRNYGEWAPNVIKSPYPDFHVPNVLFTDHFWSRHDKWGDLTAVVCSITGREITYSRLRQLCKKMATSLLKDGFKPGEVVAVILPNMPEFPVVTFGIIEAGLVISTINPMYTADEIAYQLSDSSSVAIITIPEKLENVLEAKEILSKTNKDLASKLRIICTPDVMGNEKDVPSGIEKYSKYVADSVDESILPSLQSRDGTQDDTIFIPYSSGTTGKPKGVCLTHKNLLTNIIGMHTVRDIEDASNGFQEIVPCILPGFHIYGFTIVMGQTLYCGGKVVMVPKFDENLFLKVMKAYKPTVLYVAPPLVIYIGQSPNVTKEYLESLKLILSGAAPCANSDIQKCIVKSPSTIEYRQGYGMTETSPAIMIMEKGVKKYDSVGSVCPNTLVKIADLQTGQALGPSEEGEICVKGPQVMKGYLNNEKANAEVFDSEGWFHTGDIGYYDNDKHFYITDRLKELIKVKGFQVAPAELEGILRAQPDVLDAGVIGVPDQRKGESPIAFVKLKKGATSTADDLKDYVAKKVAKYKQIDEFVFVDEIPKSASGKILRKVMKENYLKKINLEDYLK